MLPEDEILPAEEQPLPAAATPTTKSPGYIDESNPDEDPEEDLVDHPAEGGDEADDEDESSNDDEDDDVDIKGDEEEGEHLAPADSTAVALPAVDHAPSAEETGSFKTDESTATPPPHPAYCVTARMSIRPHTSISLPSDTEIAKILSPPLPPSLPLPTSPTYPLGYRAVMIRLRAEVPSTSHLLLLPSIYHLTPPSGTPPLLPIPLPTPSPPLLPPSTDPKADVRESDVGYGITHSWDEIVETMQGEPTTDETELGQKVTNLATTMRRDTDEIYMRLDDTQSERQLMASRLNLLGSDRRAHAHTTLLMGREARMSQEA
nr:hypothetical protein [Tanacetum cinerariifolium]